MNIGKKTVVLALYLPQYHEVEENSRWWGEGFTDWVNVKKAIPMFGEHYQPRIPLGENYYDLSGEEVMLEQAEVASKYGVGGFCFYHYWFEEGRTILEKPVEKYRKLKNAKTPYCLCWANHSWANTWGDKRVWDETLLEQKYGNEEEWRKHFDYLLDFFKDKKYICVDNKPVFVLYRAQDIPRGEKMISLWNEWAIANGFSGIFFIQMHTGMGYDKRINLYSAITDFEPIRTWRNPSFDCVLPKDTISENLICKDYDKIYESILGRKWEDGAKHYYCLFPDWDNTPRKGEYGRLVLGASPEKFEKYAKNILEKSMKCGKEFVFLNAWNEWAEGAYMEADEKNQYAYLHALQNAVEYAARFEWGEEPAPLREADLADENFTGVGQTLINWLLAEFAGNSIEQYLKEAGIKSIAIYGAGAIGLLLYHALANSEVYVKFFVDKKAGNIELGIPVKLIKQEEIMEQEQPDAIIITAAKSFYIIYSELKEKGVISEILSLDKIINAL